MAKRIAILGSTGTIGCHAIDVIEHLGKDYRSVALSGHRNVNVLAAQANRTGAAAIGLSDASLKNELTAKLGRTDARVYTGPSGLVDLVRRDDVDVVLSAVVGAAGLPAAFAAVEAGKTLALANKESLVVAGSLLIPKRAAERWRSFRSTRSTRRFSRRCPAGNCRKSDDLSSPPAAVPFATGLEEKIENATLADALNHPTWRMGNKITIDSATMFNKALELIEACWLFDLPPEKVQIVVHPESVIHSMVEFVDGSVIAQLSPPDMRTPIQYALTYPERAEGISRRMDWTKTFSLNFQPPDFARFPALKIAYEVAELGGTAGAVMNAANESAVAAFADGKIAFGEICRIVQHTIAKHRVQASPSLDDLLEADRWARQTADELSAASLQSELNPS